MGVFYIRMKELVQLLESTSRSAAEINKLLILARLLNPANEPALRAKALKDSLLKLKDFLHHAYAYQMVTKQARDISGEIARSSADIDAIKRHSIQHNHAQRSAKTSSMCYHCGLEE